MMKGKNLACRFAVAGVALAVLVAGLTVPTAPAEARTYIGIGFGFGYPVYAPGYYYYPPAYYYPLAYYYPPAAPAGATSSATGQTYSTTNCRDYSTTQTIGGKPQAVTGTACQQPDGSWRIVQ